MLHRAIVLFAVVLLAGLPQLNSQSYKDVVILQETGLPAADTTAPSATMLHTLFPDAQFTSAAELPTRLSNADSRLLVLPYGSAFPEDAWPQMLAYLNRGGNLLVLGGRPFTRAAYRDNSGWHLRDYNVRFIQQLGIDNFTTLAGSEGLEFQANNDLTTQLPAFSWSHAYSPILHLSSAETDARAGAAGYLSARLDVFAWGVKDGRKISAPAIQIDHLRERFCGGRWVFLNADLPGAFFEGKQATTALSLLSTSALQGAEEFNVSPSLPLYLPGEGIQLDVHWLTNHPAHGKLAVEITVTPEAEPAKSSTTRLDFVGDTTVMLPPAVGRGLHRIDARLLDDSGLRAVYHSGFWVRDEEFLHSGPKLGANEDYLTVNGKPLAVVGTTYMASDVQRLYFDHPNVYVWDRDMGQIKGAGINMLRTGWWTGWPRFMDESGKPTEKTLRTMEAFLMTARKYDLPVQFNLFAFIPDVLQGENAYLDPAAIARQQLLLGTLSRRFHAVPFLAWDLINEPSFSKTLWSMRANGDAIELAAWNKWLRNRHTDFHALAHQWNVDQLSPDEAVPVPVAGDFSAPEITAEPRTVKQYDFYEFAQQVFCNWVGDMRKALHGAGSDQLITVGQDEGGEVDRLSPAFYSSQVDFTTNHSWWHNDALLWDSLAAKQPGKPMLIQETGIMKQLSMDMTMRLTPEDAAGLLERKFALALVQGTGAIQWLWNTNDYNLIPNEVQIGILRSDRTEKPEAEVMRGYAGFSKQASASLVSPHSPEVAIITSQAEQFSAMQPFQIDAQRNAVIAASYYDHIPASIVAENRLQQLGFPKLAILPSAQALGTDSWQLLLDYVRRGGNLLVTGSLDRDEYFHRLNRAAEFFPGAEPKPVTARSNALSISGHTVEVTYAELQSTWLEGMEWKDRSRTIQQASVGKGKIFWVAYPVEASRDLNAAAEVYREVFTELGIEPGFELRSKLSPGILVYKTQLQAAVLYVMVSDSAEDAEIDLRDKTTGTALKLHLNAQRAALAVIRKQDGAVIAKYGFE